MYPIRVCLIPFQKLANLLNFSITPKQLFLLFIIMLPSIPPGMAVGFSAIALPELKLGLNESPWFASLPTLGAILGNLAAGSLIDEYGRKITFFANTIPSIIGYITLATTQDVLYLYIGQILVGFSQGAATLAPTAYIAESLAPDNLQFRSSLASWTILAISIGICLVYLFGWLFYYTYVAMIGAALSFISTILLWIYIPESPSWLEQKSKFKEAREARLRLGFDEPYESSLTHGYQSLDPEDETFMSHLAKIRRKDVYKPALITTFFFLFQQSTGVQVFTAYMVDIISVKSLSINPYCLTVVSGFVVIVAQMTYVVVVPLIGVRKTCIISSLGAAVSGLILSVCIIISNTTQWYANLVDVIHILAVWAFFYIGAAGIGTAPYSILGEIFPEDAKGFAAIPVFGVSIFYFAIVMIFPYTFQFSAYAIYVVFSVTSLMTAAYTYFFVPETVGRTLNEIMDEFRK